MQTDPKYYIRGVMDRDKLILARAITLVESMRPDHQVTARKIINGLLPETGKAIRLGITGVPGVGKSVFIQSLGLTLLKKGHKVAVLAVDPSSTKSGGSIMADKTRMDKLSSKEDAFIRPSPSGGTLGGVAGKTKEAMLLCEAAGFDVVIVETVGVGQSETAVASMVDFFLVLMLAGAGDELQGIKKGILELADALVITKADGNNVENTERAKSVYENALHLLRPANREWSPPVLTCSALEMTGISEVWDNVLEFKKKMTRINAFDARRKHQAVEWMESLINEGLKSWFFKKPEIENLLPGLKRKVEKGEIEPFSAAEKLLFFLDNRNSL